MTENNGESWTDWALNGIGSFFNDANGDGYKDSGDILPGLFSWFSGSNTKDGFGGGDLIKTAVSVFAGYGASKLGNNMFSKLGLALIVPALLWGALSFFGGDFEQAANGDNQEYVDNDLEDDYDTELDDPTLEI